MAFTVSRTDGGTKDSTFVDYAAFWGGKGSTSGDRRAPRSPARAGDGCTCGIRGTGQAFSKELKKQAGHRAGR